MDKDWSGDQRRRLDAIRRWATLLDAAVGIPGTRLRVGLDALVGLIPGVGDAFSGVFSALLIMQAAKLGLPKVVLLRMAANSLIDLVVGAIPILGDLFDLGWKANLRNVALLERAAIHGRHAASAGDYVFAAGLVTALLLLLVLPLAGLALLLSALGRPVF